MFNRKKKHIEDQSKNRIKSQNEASDDSANESIPADNQKKDSKKNKLPFNKVFRFITQLLDGSLLTRKYAIDLLPYFIFLAFIGILYIANSYSAQQKVKDIENLNTKLEDLRNEHKSVKAELMYYKKMSEVAKRLESTGIKEPTVPPNKIVINNEAKVSE
jgi:hypothetical protein